MAPTVVKRRRIDRDAVLLGACEKSARSLASVIQKASPRAAPAETAEELVDTLTGVIAQTAELLLAGKSVRVVEDDDDLTTQEAADLLNVSRPYLVKLLDTEQIPQLPKVGRHRRVARSAVMRYKRIRDAEREAALAELAVLSQRHRLGY